MVQRRFTLLQLVDEAHDTGYEDVGERLLKFFVTTGLLDRAQVGHSRGRGKGIPRYWLEPQRDLLLQLLKNRASGTHRTATLCNLPMFWWLYRGDSFVPLRQAKRALKTWLDETRQPYWTSWRRSTHSARERVDGFLPDLRGDERDSIVHALANIAYAGRFDADELRAQLRNAAPPTNAVTINGETRYVTDNAIGQIEATLYARDRIDSVPDSLFRFARAELRQWDAEYAANQPQWALDQHLGHLNTPVTADRLANNACFHVAQMLGHLLMAGDLPSTARADALHG
jgi:hypothetical protein